MKQGQSTCEPAHPYEPLVLCSAPIVEGQPIGFWLTEVVFTVVTVYGTRSGFISHPERSEHAKVPKTVNTRHVDLHLRLDFSTLLRVSLSNRTRTMPYQQQQQRQQQHQQQQLGRIPSRWSILRCEPELLEEPEREATRPPTKGATRSKDGNIKGRAHGGGPLQSSGRARLGAIGPLSTTTVRTCTVIDQSQTLLYCSEECRKKNLEWSWPVPILSASEPAHLTTKSKFHGKEKRTSPGTHPAQLDPAYAYPPPPDSCFAPNYTIFARRPRHNDAPFCSESETSSNAIGTSFTTSNTADKRPLLEGGILWCLQSLFSLGHSGQRAGEGREDFMGEAEREARANKRAGEAEEAKIEEMETMSPGSLGSTTMAKTLRPARLRARRADTHSKYTRTPLEVSTSRAHSVVVLQKPSTA
ncbi:hypothetical protein DFH11DRAFT_1543041 [Phellopilus nigrolimitatus]|nr:hypothetical protein DFH11DRAFT_1543041 [Phellopilus nigrolimitatus]